MSAERGEGGGEEAKGASRRRAAIEMDARVITRCVRHSL